MLRSCLRASPHEAKASPMQRNATAADLAGPAFEADLDLNPGGPVAARWSPSNRWVKRWDTAFFLLLRLAAVQGF